MKNERNFTCGHCGKTHTINPEWTEADVHAEMDAMFKDGIKEEEQLVVCDECYDLLMVFNDRGAELKRYRDEGGAA